MKIDMHCHTTNRELSDVVCGDASLDAIKRHMDEHGIVKTNLLATYFPHKGSGISNYRLHNWIRDRPEFFMFGSLDFDTFYYQGLNELEEMAENKLIKGIKIYTCYQHIDLKSERFKRLTYLAEQYRLPMMFHCGYSYTANKKYGRMAITDVVKATDIPQINTDVIISHMSKPFLDEVIQAAKHPNVYTDMSGLLNSLDERDELPEAIEDIKRFLGECGPEKLLFGTDFPVQTHADSVYLIEQAMREYSEEEKQAVYYENAARLIA